MSADLLVLRLVLRAATPSGNQTLRRHWAARRRDSGDWTMLLAEAIGRFDGAYLPRGDDGVRRRLLITRVGVRLLDVDNLAGGAKQLIDAIRRRGLIADDRPDCVDLQFAQRRCERGAAPCTVVEFYESDPDARQTSPAIAKPDTPGACPTERCTYGRDHAGPCSTSIEAGRYVWPRPKTTPALDNRPDRGAEQETPMSKDKKEPGPPKQTRLRGTDTARIGDIEDAAIALYRTRQARASLGEKAKTQGAVLADAMHRHGKTSYRCEDEALVVHVDPKETIRVEPPGEEE